MACLHCHVHKSCLPDLHQICSVTTVFWTGSRRDVSELCNHQERSSLPTDFTGLYLQCQLGSLFGLECYDWLWLACCAVEVESFARKAPITETNLDRLERRIQSRAQGKAWESRSESRKVEKSFDKSVCCLFPLLYSTSLPKNFSKTICSDSWWCIYREQSHQRHFETWQAWFKWHSHANLQSQKSWCQWCQPKWVLAFSCVFSFSQLFAILAFFNVCQQTKTWCFATFSWTSTSEIGGIFTDFLVFFFWIFVSLCPNCYGLVWFIEDPSRGSTLAWVKGARVPRQKRKSNTICQETTYTVPQIYMLFSFRLFSACVRGYS